LVVVKGLITKLRRRPSLKTKEELGIFKKNKPNQVKNREKKREGQIYELKI